MTQIRDGEDSIGRLHTGLARLSVAAAVGVIYLCDRTYRRWLKENHPLAEHRARVRRLKTGYQRKRANTTEVVEVIVDVLAEIARATSTGGRMSFTLLPDALSEGSDR